MAQGRPGPSAALRIDCGRGPICDGELGSRPPALCGGRLRRDDGTVVSLNYANLDKFVVPGRRALTTRCCLWRLWRSGRSWAPESVLSVALQAATFVLPATCRRRAGIYPRSLHVEHRAHARTAFAAGVLLIVGLAGCASELTPRPNRLPADAAPYVGVFTGEFVDGKPLYRLPTIHVVGSRSSIGPDT